MIRVDPEFQSIIPALSDDEGAGLERSLKADGCRDALVVWSEEGILLEGHNRFVLCTANDIPFRAVEISFASRSDALAWVIENQLGRRNLNPYQRSKLALRKKAILAEEARKRQEAARFGANDVSPCEATTPPVPSTLTAPQETRDSLACAAGVSAGTIHKVGVIEANADEETKAKLESGAMSIDKAYKAVKKTQNKRSTCTRKGKRKAIAENGSLPTDTLARECCDCGCTDKAVAFFVVCGECRTIST